MTAATPPRERNRRETETRIELSAAQLALEKGFAHVTVDDICERAGVARSTFFKYFSSRDAAIVGRTITVLPHEQAFEVFNAHADSLPRGIFELIFASVGHAKIDSDVARARQELSRTQPDARSVGTLTLIDAGVQLMAVARDWLIAHPEHARLDDPEAEAALASNTAYAAISTMAGGWMSASGDITASGDEFDAALADLRRVVADEPRDAH